MALEEQVSTDMTSEQLLRQWHSTGMYEVRAKCKWLAGGSQGWVGQTRETLEMWGVSKAFRGHPELQQPKVYVMARKS